jgi:hypothetical protein
MRVWAGKARVTLTPPLAQGDRFRNNTARSIKPVCSITNRRSAVRSTLVAALVACADNTVRGRARRFLLGLSSDELQFIAEFYGACILEATGGCRSRSQLAARIAEFQEARLNCSRSRPEDEDHKMILLLEYLCRCGVSQVRAAASNA